MTRLARGGCGILILRPKEALRPPHVWTDCQVIDIDDSAVAVNVTARAAVRAVQQPRSPAEPGL